MDEPTADPALIMAYLVCREARREVTVMLSGLGGDELLGGYRKYIAAQDARRYQRLPGPLRAHVLDPLFRQAPARPGTPWAGYGRLMRKWGRSASMPPREQFVMNGTYLGVADRDSAADRASTGTCTSGGSSASTRRRSPRSPARTGSIRCSTSTPRSSWRREPDLQRQDTAWRRRSRSASRSSIVELVDWVAASIPPSLKLRGRETKSVLRQAFGDAMPAEVLQQAKAGFGARSATG